MAAKFLNIDRNTPLLQPPDLRDWVPVGHLAHFIIDAAAALNRSTAKANERGIGSIRPHLRPAAAFLPVGGARLTGGALKETYFFNKGAAADAKEGEDGFFDRC